MTRTPHPRLLVLAPIAVSGRARVLATGPAADRAVAMACLDHVTYSHRHRGHLVTPDDAVNLRCWAQAHRLVLVERTTR